MKKIYTCTTSVVVELVIEVEACSDEAATRIVEGMDLDEVISTADFGKKNIEFNTVNEIEVDYIEEV